MLGNVEEEKSLEKFKPVISNDAELREAIEKAFDYRGDVSLTQKNGTQLVGYVYNRNAEAPEPYLNLLVAGTGEKVRILYRDIVEIYFSGQDMAAGKSWASYMKRYNDRKAAEGQAQASGPNPT